MGQDNCELVKFIVVNVVGDGFGKNREEHGKIPNFMSEIWI
jgi:hypothetical protein